MKIRTSACKHENRFCWHVTERHLVTSRASPRSIERIACETHTKSAQTPQLAATYGDADGSSKRARLPYQADSLSDSWNLEFSHCIYLERII